MKLSNRIRIVLNVILLLILLAVGIYLEKPHGRPTGEQGCQLVERADADESGASYGRLLSSGYRDVRSRRVTMVPLGETTAPAPALNNVCEQRWYLARLVSRLSDAGAAVIVIDKYFGWDSCATNDQGTSDLIRAIQISAAPVVVGAATHAPESHSEKSCLILSPSLDFGAKPTVAGEPTKPAAYYGLTRLNSDPRKIPINWYVYESDQAWKANDEPTDEIKTLSYTAAVLIDPGLANESRLRLMWDSGRHPFTSFIKSDSMSHINALDFLCSGPDKADIESRYSVMCDAHPWNGSEIRGQVIVVGDDVAGRDRHQLLGSEVPGSYIQANYIESLLDGRYLKPTMTAWNVGALIAWLLLLFLLFWLLQPELALFICLVVAGCVWYVSVQLIVWKGIYLGMPLETLGIVALLAKYVEARGHKIGELIRERGTGHKRRVSRRRAGAALSESGQPTNGTPGISEP
jgi:hypothetical protein